MNVYEQPYTLPGISVKREGDNIMIALKTSEEADYQLLMGNKPVSDAIDTVIAVSRDGSFEVDLPVAGGPYYFIIRKGRNRTDLFSERVLPLKQAINVRDMGGYETDCGKRLKWGMLYRGDQLSKLETEDIAVLEAVGLTSVVDYRSKHECTLNPNKVIGTVKQVFFCDPHSSFSEAAANAIDLHSENVKLVKALENGEVESKYINGKGEKVILSYRELVTSPAARDAYGRFLKACADPAAAPLLHHCRGGKDRTGFGSMLILLLLGVKREQIIDDYVMTGTIRSARNQLKYEQYCELTGNRDYLDYLMSLIETRREYIEASMDRIAELYHSVDEYMIRHFDMKEEEIAAMRNFYLEEGCGNWGTR